MTAEIGILNKTAIVLAADSAVTINDTGKVYNTANKIFQLSYVHPVAIMIYNNAQWMGIPWEIIIKQYSEKLGAKSFATIENYVNDFMRFIKVKFCPKITYNTQIDYLKDKLNDVLKGFDIITNEHIQSSIDEGTIKRPKTEKEETELFSFYFEKIVEVTLKDRIKQRKRLKEFRRYPLTELIKFSKKLS